jgi:hypothetical protein
MSGYSKEQQLANAPGGRRNKIARDPKHNRQRSQAQERGLTDDYKEIGFPKARKVPGSGAFHEAMLYSDVEVEDLFLAECKETRTGKMVIDPEWVGKVRAEAVALGKKFWAIHAWMAKDEGHYKKLVVVDETTWMSLLRERNELRQENKYLREDLAGEDDRR